MIGSSNDSLLRMTHRTLRNILLVRLLVYYKRILKEMNQQPDEKIYRVRSLNEELMSIWSLELQLGGTWKHSSFLMWKLSENINKLSWVFMEASLCNHDWLSHWPLAVELKSPAPLSYPKVKQWNCKFQTSNHRVSSPGK